MFKVRILRKNKSRVTFFLSDFCVYWLDSEKLPNSSPNPLAYNYNKKPRTKTHAGLIHREQVDTIKRNLSAMSIKSTEHSLCLLSLTPSLSRHHLHHHLQSRHLWDVNQLANSTYHSASTSLNTKLRPFQSETDSQSQTRGTRPVFTPMKQQIWHLQQHMSWYLPWLGKMVVVNHTSIHFFDWKINLLTILTQWGRHARISRRTCVNVIGRQWSRDYYVLTVVFGNLNLDVWITT